MATVSMKTTVTGEKAKSPVEECMDWIYEQKAQVESARYGMNKRSVEDAISEQKQKARTIAGYQKEIDKALAQTYDEKEKTRLQDAYNTLKEISQKKLNCLDTMLGIVSLEENCSVVSNDFDMKSVQLARVHQQKMGGDAVGENIPGFAAPSSQDCVFAAKDNWNWIYKLVQCVDIHLKNGGAYHQFFHDVLENEQWLLRDLARLHKRFEIIPMKPDYEDAQRLLQEIQDITLALRQWEMKGNTFWDQATKLVPVHLRTQGITVSMPARSLCNYETKEIHIRDGEDIVLLDNSKTEMWKVRNCRGQEAYVPSVCVLIPGPFKEAIDAAVKMRLQLLAAWTNTLKRVGKRLLCFMLMVFKPDYSTDEIHTMKSIRMLEKKELLRILDYIEDTLKTHWKDHEGFHCLQERILMLRMILEQAGDDIAEDENSYKALVVQITMLEKLMNKYKDLWRDWETFKVALETSQAPELMLIVDKWEQLKFVSKAYFSKYWQTELPFDELEKSIMNLRSLTIDGSSLISEETDGMEESGFDELVVKETQLKQAAAVNGNAPLFRSTSLVSEGGLSEEGFDEERVVETFHDFAEMQQQVETTDVDNGEFGFATETKTAKTEQLSSAEMEEKKTFVISSVVDTRDNSEISLPDAIMHGIIKPDDGIYCNMKTEQTIPIPLAMSQGLIHVQFTTTRRSREKKSSVGIITVKTIRERIRPYTIKSVTDTLPDEVLTKQEAIQRGIVDERHGIYYDRKARREMLVADAIGKKLIEAEYQGEAPAPEVVQQTYAVRAVVDRAAKKIVTFQEAVSRGVIDKETGIYRDSITGDTMYVADAIMRGFLKARIIDDPNQLNIDPENKMFIDKTEAIRKRVVRPLTVISAFKKAARLASENHK